MAAPTNWIEELQKAGVSYPLASSYILDTTESGSARFKMWQDIIIMTNGYIHTQTSSASVWSITHNLDNRYPQVKILDAVGDECVGDIDYVDENNLIITFTDSISGVAVLK